VASRFDYVKYDQAAVLLQEHFKQIMSEIESDINSMGVNSINRAPPGSTSVMSLARSKAMALTKLEELYMWLGKAVRDEQLIRNGSAPLQEERTDG
jgi:hypothetical protein